VFTTEIAICEWIAVLGGMTTEIVDVGFVIEVFGRGSKRGGWISWVFVDFVCVVE
jgi:hypothetical protein